MSVPALRFPEFSGEWEENSLEEIADKKISYGIVQAGPHIPGGMPYIKSKDLNGPLMLSSLERTSDAIAKSYRRSEVYPGDIVFSLRGNIGVSQIVPKTIAVANLTQGTARISVNDRAVNSFVFSALETRKIRKRIFSVMKGSTFQEISLGDLRQIKLHITSPSEQKKIAAFLGVVDEKLAALRARRVGLETYKRGLMQKLFSRTLRFTKVCGSAFPDWEEKRLGEILTERRELQTKLDGLPHISLTTEGVVPKSDRYNRDFLVGDDDAKKYKVTRLGDLCYNPANLKFGVISINHLEDGIFSPIYVTFEIGNVDHRLLEFYVKQWSFQKRVRRFEQGTVYERQAVSPEDFLKAVIPFPHLDEQRLIADALQAMDAKIQTVGDQITRMEAFKKGLLQQMFV